jgi:hypothetical protein
MARPPEGARAREYTITARFSEEDRKMLEENRNARGVKNTSLYLRNLVREDSKRSAKDRA